MAGYLSNEEVQQIKQRWQPDSREDGNHSDACRDIQRLAAEVERLRAAEAAGNGGD